MGEQIADLTLWRLYFHGDASYHSMAASSTKPLKANPNRLAFFCLLPRVCAGSCGLRREPFLPSALAAEGGSHQELRHFLVKNGAVG